MGTQTRIVTLHLTAREAMVLWEWIRWYSKPPEIEAVTTKVEEALRQV